VRVVVDVWRRGICPLVCGGTERKRDQYHGHQHKHRVDPLVRVIGIRINSGRHGKKLKSRKVKSRKRHAAITKWRERGSSNVLLIGPRSDQNARKRSSLKTINFPIIVSYASGGQKAGDVRFAREAKLGFNHECTRIGHELI